MTPSPTEEIKAIRDRLAAACGYDLDRIVEETRRHQRESGRVYLTSLEESPASEGSAPPPDRESISKQTST